MTRKLLARLAGPIGAAGFLLGLAVAKPVTIVPGDPPIKADIPATWKVSEIKRGIQAKTADGEVFLWFESYRPSQLEALLAEHNAYFKGQGVIITAEPKASAEEYPNYALKVSTYPATYEGKPTVLRYLSVVPKAEGKRHLLLSYWASPEGDEEYRSEMKAILQSLAASVDAM